MPTAATRSTCICARSCAYCSRQRSVRARASGASRRVRSTPCPRRVIVARSTTASSPLAARLRDQQQDRVGADVDRRRATHGAVCDGAFGHRAFDWLERILATPASFGESWASRGCSGSAFPRRSAEPRARRGGSSAGLRRCRWSPPDRCRRSRRRSSSSDRGRAALFATASVREPEHRARAHRRKAPVVLERAAGERLRVRVAGDLELARVESPRRRGSPRPTCRRIVVALLLQLLAPGIEQHVAGQLDQHAVVAHLDLEAELVSFFSLVRSSSKRLRI